MDDDDNFVFFPDWKGGLTTGNDFESKPDDCSCRYVELEFNHREVRGFATPWWSTFQALVDRPDSWKAISSHISKSGSARALVYGLFGIDCEHGCKSEYHPVYALAIEVPATTTDNASDYKPESHDRWAIFARNWGNEGWCSQYNHELCLGPNGGGDLAIELPRQGSEPVISSAVFAARNDTSATSPPEIQFNGATRRVVVVFHLPTASQKDVQELELELAWPTIDPEPPRACATKTFELLSMGEDVEHSATSNEPTSPREGSEELMTRLMKKAGQDLHEQSVKVDAQVGLELKQTRRLQTLDQRTPEPFSFIPGVCNPAQIRKLAADTDKKKWDQELLKTFCQSMAKNPNVADDPDFRLICKRPSPLN